jgi:gas vesicle protein
MSTGKVLLGVLAGVAAGAVLGILFAPHKGKVTRRKIVRSGEDYAENLKEQFNQFLDSVTEKFDNAKDDLNDLVDKGKKTVNETEKEARAARG